MIKENIWLIGTGLMSLEYAKVLQSLNCDFVVIGRGEENCRKFAEVTNIHAIKGGLDVFLETKPALPNAVIVAVGIESLSQTTIKLLNYGVKYVLLEKPGIGYLSELEELVNTVRTAGATILLAYNRRFYASILAAEEMIKADGGPTSMHFEFTEWSHVIAPMKKDVAEHNNWFLGNSSHIIDTAFLLGGIPDKMSCYVTGGLAWHPASSIFAGSGITKKGVLFSYHANWEAPGRWSLEVLTRKRRFILKPMEKLSLQQIGSVAVESVEINDKLDQQFKPGLYLQTKCFLEKDQSRFIDIYQQQQIINDFYKRMSNYQ